MATAKRYNSKKKTIVGQQIALRRRALGYSGADFAGMVGVSQVTISHYETGRCKPNLDHLVSIADTLGVTVDELLSPNVTLELSEDVHVDKRRA
jgi:transcriptional regulator with XRE-family HTH domain